MSLLCTFFLAQISNPGDKEKSNNKPKYAKVLQIVLYTLDDTVVSPYLLVSIIVYIWKEYAAN